jgi:hypothetical protein
MGTSFYEVATPDDGVFEIKDSFLENPNFEERFFKSLKPKKEHRISVNFSRMIAKDFHDADRVKNWARLCITINGFRAKYGKWPKRVTSHFCLMDDIKKRILSNDSFRKLHQKIELITRDETSSEHAIVAEDDTGSVFIYGKDGFGWEPDISAEEWLGIRPDRINKED